MCIGLSRMFMFCFTGDHRLLNITSTCDKQTKLQTLTQSEHTHNKREYLHSRLPPRHRWSFSSWISSLARPLDYAQPLLPHHHQRQLHHWQKSSPSKTSLALHALRWQLRELRSAQHQPTPISVARVRIYLYAPHTHNDTLTGLHNT
jgi:hypothetical protein